MTEDQAVVCDPSIEECEFEFKNTIELNYLTPSNIVGIVSIVNAIVPWFMYQRFFLEGKTNTQQTQLDDNGLFKLGWRWAGQGSLYLWALPAVVWSLSRVTETFFFPLLLLVWWTAIQNALTPIVALVALFGFLKSLTEWDSAWEIAFTKKEAWFTGLTWLGWSGTSYYLWKKNFNLAIMYYDEVLQEKHEEVIQFGEPEKEEDLP